MMERRNLPIRGTRLAGFTLVELLVVLGIISVLMSLLLPALNRARATARGVACLSNLRQMATAAFAYADANDGRLPVAYWEIYEGTTTISFAWDVTTVITPAGKSAGPGLLWPGEVDATAVTQCPEFAGGANWHVDEHTGYNYNTSYLGHGQGESVPEPAKLTDVRNGPQVAMFGDGEWAGGANKFMRAPFPNPGDVDFKARSTGTQGYRHRDRTNVAWADGHATAWEERHTTSADGAGDVAPGTGFLSADNGLYDLE